MHQTRDEGVDAFEYIDIPETGVTGVDALVYSSSTRKKMNAKKTALPCMSCVLLGEFLCAPGTGCSIFVLFYFQHEGLFLNTPLPSTAISRCQSSMLLFNEAHLTHPTWCALLFILLTMHQSYGMKDEILTHVLRTFYLCFVSARTRYLFLQPFIIAEVRRVDCPAGGLSSLPWHRGPQRSPTNTASAQRERVQGAGLPRLPRRECPVYS